MKTILQSGRNCWDVAPVAQAGLLIDGRDYFRAFYEAARQARRYILITGWQFDSEAKLLVGRDAPATDEDVRFMPFLNGLCRKNPALQVRLLAWDFSPIFTFKREFMQSVIFNWQTEDNFKFLFDNAFPIGGSHHHKFVVIDGWVGFTGGLDFCEGRWDVPEHTPENRHRLNGNGHPFNPHHDIQACVVGPAAGKLSEVFVERWERAGGDRLELPAPRPAEVAIPFSVPIHSNQVALSRTQPRLVAPPVQPVQEIRELYLAAIAAAERVIYIENQYFSSQAVYQALLARLRERRRSPLQVVLVLPKHNLGWLEEVSMGVTQARMLQTLQHAAAETNNALGIYYSARLAHDGSEQPVYIHSKLMIVDDRFLTVGSANTNNRSMGLDTELNFTWEDSSARCIRSIRAARVALLAEHTGVRRLGRTQLGRTRQLAGLLNRIAQRKRSQLRRHPMCSLFADDSWLHHIADDLQLDYENPIVEETLYETISSAPDTLLARGITRLSKWLNT